MYEFVDMEHDKGSINRDTIIILTINLHISFHRVFNMGYFAFILQDFFIKSRYVFDPSSNGNGSVKNASFSDFQSSRCK